MPAPDDFSRELLGPILRLKTAFQNPTHLMRRIGALTLATSQKAFREQRLGDLGWATRYPFQQAPFLNIAGVVSDFSAGRNAPKPNRFSNTPALVDEGMRGGLWGSLSTRTIGPFISETGSAKSYAATHQHGGTSRQPITNQVKEKIKRWLWTERGGRRVLRSGRNRGTYANMLTPLLHKRVLTTRIFPRPFLGITDELEQKLLRATKQWFDERQRGSGGSVEI